MLFASTWRFAFAFGMGRMNRDLQGPAAAEAETTEDPYLRSATHDMWSAAAEDWQASALSDSLPVAPPLDIEGDTAAAASPSAAVDDDLQSEGELDSDCDSISDSGGVGARRAVAMRPAVSRLSLLQFRHYESIANLPSAASTANATPIFAEAAGGLPRGQQPSARIPFSLLQYTLGYLNTAARPLPLACAAGNPSLRLAVESTGSLHAPNGHTSTALALLLSPVEPDTRTVRSPSLRCFLAHAEVAGWWWRRLTTLGRRDSQPSDGHDAGSLSRGPPALCIDIAQRAGKAPAAAASPLKRPCGLPPRPPMPLYSDAPLPELFDAAMRPFSGVGACVLAGLSAQGPRTVPLELLAVRALSGLHSLGLRGSQLLTDTAAIGRLALLVELDLAYSGVSDLSGLTRHGTPHLARVSVKGCKGLRSLSPLGELPALREVVASQSAVASVNGLACSRSLVSVSFYGCLGLDDLSPLGAVPTLQELYASESNVTSIHGLGHSRSLSHLGLRYCDLASLEALAGIPTLRVLNVSCTPIASVQCLSRAPALTHIDLTSCAQLRDVGPLGSVATLTEILASGSGVASVLGLGQAAGLRLLLLNNCAELRALPGLGAARHLTWLELNSSGVADIAGLASSPSLAVLDVGFCKRLEDLSVLMELPALRQVKVAGSAGVPALATGRLREANPELCIDV